MRSSARISRMLSASFICWKLANNHLFWWRFIRECWDDLLP